MIAKTVKYKDYNGNDCEDKFYFNLTKAELTEMELGINGGLADYIKKIVDTNNTEEIINIFKKLVLKSYGVKSEDGKRFRKTSDSGVPLSIEFSESPAYSVLFMELATDDKSAAEFVNGIVPSDLASAVQAEVDKQNAKNNS
jgi:hypothetical protein